jgi:hypothetical protein
MKGKMPLVMCDDEGHEETITDAVVLEKVCQPSEQGGLTLAEAKTLLTALQQRIVERQVAACLSVHRHCQACGQVLRMKGHHSRTFRTLLGTIMCTSPRLHHCPCRPPTATTFSPLTVFWSEPTALELLFMETKGASLVSYGLAVQAWQDFLPVEATLSVSTVRTNALAVAQWYEAEQAEEQWSFLEGCPPDWGHLPIPDSPITLGLDGGYVRDWDEKQRQFEVMVGKSIIAVRRDEKENIPASQGLGCVQTLDTKPTRRLFEVLKSQGLQMNQPLTVLSDGGDTVRDLQVYLSPEAEHLLDWFHLVRQEAA